MKRRAYAYEPRNNRLYGFAAMGIVTALVVFLLVYPSVEREAYLVELRTGGEDSWDSAILHLCWIRPGKLGLDALLDEVEVTRRFQIVQHAASLGCLPNLATRHQIAHWMHNANEMHRVAGHGVAALEIVVAALTMESEAARARGQSAALALLPSLPEAERGRLEALVVDAPDEFPALAKALGLTREEPPQVQIPIATPAEEAARVDARRASTHSLMLARRVATPEFEPVFKSSDSLELKLRAPTLEAPQQQRGPLFVSPRSAEAVGEGVPSAAPTQEGSVDE